jgi:cell division protein FtsI/penicillin-binding protein 2
LLGAAPWLSARSHDSLAPMFRDAAGTAVVLDAQNTRVLAVHRPDVAADWLVRPGSTLKPFTIYALLEAGKLLPTDRFLCPGTLSIAGRSFNCSHPPVATPMVVSTAIAYSCNCFVAHFARRFEPGELARHLQSFGLGSLTGLLHDFSSVAEASGRVSPAVTPDESAIQALGEDRILVTPLGLAAGYRSLAMRLRPPNFSAVLEGLEGAVEYGTAQLAAQTGESPYVFPIAGKTGSVRTIAGGPVAWFSGFAPSRSPRWIVTVAVHARSGGASAAPIGGRILEARNAGRL